ncbi:zinc finger protein 782-like [Chrysoperla carnea]|uniref:zinc finger protein 782-like n=1 Tax=Chrysoperla carnea TaxID=189513 RepID=UPI001D06C13E|nr:zinc finger protein 782-like [Chrysoperla carnea]
MDSKNIFCRLCAELQPDYHLLKITDVKAVNMNLANKILHCYNVKITADDILPRHVCLNCCDKVINAFEFHELVHKSQEFLAKQINVDVNIMYVEVKHEKVDSDVCTKKDFHLNNDNEKYEDDFSINTKTENESDTTDNLEDGNTFLESKSSLEDSQNSLSPKQDYVSDGDDKCEVQETKKVKCREKWKCIECNIFLPTHKQYCNHYLHVHKKEADYPCPECTKKYDKYESFLEHRRMQHSGRKLICKICNKICYSSLKRHMETHSSLTPFSCTECNKSFKSKECLQRHRNVHLPEGIKKKNTKVYSCELCPRTFAKKANLNYHKENHNPGEPVKKFVCDQCGNNFSRKESLTVHMTIHLSTAEFRCDKCPKAFKNVYSLNRHKKSHIEGQPFKCDICLRRFKYKRALKQHGLIHTNQLPYECEHCPKRFREKTNLRVHLRQHTGERPYSCLECNHNFTNNSNFIKHLKGRHGLQNVSVANQWQYPFVNKTDVQN